MSLLLLEIDDKYNYPEFSTIKGSTMPKELPALSKAKTWDYESHLGNSGNDHWRDLKYR